MRRISGSPSDESKPRDHFWAGVVAGVGLTVVGQYGFGVVKTLAAYQSVAAFVADVQAALTAETIAVVDLIPLILVGMLVWMLALAAQYMGGGQI
jgi:hypothetical protein